MDNNVSRCELNKSYYDFLFFFFGCPEAKMVGTCVKKKRSEEVETDIFVIYSSMLCQSFPYGESLFIQATCVSFFVCFLFSFLRDPDDPPHSGFRLVPHFCYFAAFKKHGKPTLSKFGFEAEVHILAFFFLQ